MTGKYPSTIRASINGNEKWADASPLVTKTLADEGYDCGLAGKLHLSTAFVEEKRPDDGYRVFHWSHDPRDRWDRGHAYAHWLNRQGFVLGELRKDPAAIPPELHQTTWCTDRYDPSTLPGPLFRESDLKTQERLRDVAFQSKARRPDPVEAKKKTAAYYAMIELIDHNVGRLLDALDRTGHRENTIVIFMSDHGEMLGDHGLRQKGCRFYEGLVRVPLIISWPKRFLKGVQSDALVELVDIVPTLLDACGVDVVNDTHGRSLVPILTGAASPDHHRNFVRSEYYNALHFSEPFPINYGTMVRTRKHKLVVYHGHDVGELYDLEDDPHEFVNRWDDPEYANIRFELMKMSFDAMALSVDLGPRRVHPF